VAHIHTKLHQLLISSFSVHARSHTVTDNSRTVSAALIMSDGVF